jgi:hypothetical protein
MRFKVLLHHVKEARIQIRCEASILNIYKRDRLEEIFVKTHSAENLATPQNDNSSGTFSQANTTTKPIIMNIIYSALIILAFESIVMRHEYN